MRLPSSHHHLGRLVVILALAMIVVVQFRGSSKNTMKFMDEEMQQALWNLMPTSSLVAGGGDKEEEGEVMRFTTTLSSTGTATASIKDNDDDNTQGYDNYGNNKKEAEEATTDAATSKEQKKQDKPFNIVVLYPDDWRHDTLGGLLPVVRTPFLNQLAREGIRFTHNMVTTSICWISRATFFTGQYCSRHKSYRLRQPVFYDTWANTSWPALLQAAGYVVAHIGKWQYMNPNNNFVQTHLFNYSVLFEGKHSFTFNGQMVSAAEKTYLEVKQFLDQRTDQEQPFALTAAFYPPKAIGNSFEPGAQWFPQASTVAKYYANEVIPRPYNETDAYSKLPYFFHVFERGGRSRWEERFESDEQYQTAMKHYYSLVTEVDEACQKIYDDLKQRNLLDNTMIIFTTDNGLFHAEHGLAGKWYPYQESIRVPLIIRDPRMPTHKVGTLNSDLTLNIDLHPTILDAAGLLERIPTTIQGRNIADLYMNNKEDADAVDTDANDNKSNQNSDAASSKTPWRTDFLYEFPLDNGKTMPMSTAVVRKDLKYIYWPQFQYEQLFNLTEDPLELNDVLKNETYAHVLKGLQARHADLLEHVK